MALAIRQLEHQTWQTGHIIGTKMDVVKVSSGIDEKKYRWDLKSCLTFHSHCMHNGKWIELNYLISISILYMAIVFILHTGKEKAHTQTYRHRITVSMSLTWANIDLTFWIAESHIAQLNSRALRRALSFCWRVAMRVKLFLWRYLSTAYG